MRVECIGIPKIVPQGKDNEGKWRKQRSIWRSNERIEYITKNTWRKRTSRKKKETLEVTVRESLALWLSTNDRSIDRSRFDLSRRIFLSCLERDYRGRERVRELQSLFVYNTEDTGVRPNHELRLSVGEWLYLALRYPRARYDTISKIIMSAYTLDLSLSNQDRWKYTSSRKSARIRKMPRYLDHIHRVMSY